MCVSMGFQKYGNPLETLETWFPGVSTFVTLRLLLSEDMVSPRASQQNRILRLGPSQFT